MVTSMGEGNVRVSRREPELPTVRRKEMASLKV
jgi:hypothetical protein